MYFVRNYSKIKYLIFRIEDGIIEERIGRREGEKERRREGEREKEKERYEFCRERIREFYFNIEGRRRIAALID